MVGEGEKAPSSRPLPMLLSALAVALVALFTLVLPAEYGIDPLGTGRLLGLSGMAQTSISPYSEADAPYRTDRATFVLDPFVSVEYKYSLAEGATLVFAWRADGEVVYDFHSEVEGGSEGEAVSFVISRADRAQGTYVAPFAGRHGWFWENRGSNTVTVELNAAGHFDEATTYTDRGPRTRRIGPDP